MKIILIYKRRENKKMDNESKIREIEKCKEILKNPTLRYNERTNLEFYLKSLEKK